MIYFDNAATSPPFPETIAAVAEAMRATVGNPASPHAEGLAAERAVKEARVKLARILGAAPDELVFTSGGTESINTALLGVWAANPRLPRRVVATEAEHPAVLRCLERLEERGVATVRIGVVRNGGVRLDELEDALRTPTGLVSLLHANNETGAVQPMDRIAALLRAAAPDALLHLDCVQSFGKVPLALARWGVRFASFSAHKFHGPKGVGLLYAAKGARFEPLLVGGGQQDGRRSGTENPPLAVGMAAAAAEMARRSAEVEDTTRRLRRTILDGLARLEHVAPVVLSPEDGLPGILNAAFPGARSETLVNALSARGVCVSAMSACSSRRKRTSHVLLAMGVPESLAASAIRISTSVLNTEAEAQAFLAALAESLASILPKR